MKKNIVPKIIIAVVIVIMFIPVIIEMVGNNILKTIEFDKLEDTISNTSNYQFALVYVAPSSDENIKDSKTSVRDIVEAYNTSSDTLQVYYMDYDELSYSEISSIYGDDYETSTAYMFIANGELIKVINEDLSDSELDTYVKAYSSNGVDESIQAYKVLETAKEYQALVKKKKTVTMAVFGRDSCFYCNKFKVVYNTVADEYGLDIYYFDSDSYDEDEYDKIMDLGLKIPASCSSTGEEVDLQPGFGTPLTLFTKNGKVIDCISGYVNKSELITKLETVGMIDAE